MSVESSKITTSDAWLSILAIVLLLGTVGRVDYEDALEQERLESQQNLMLQSSVPAASADTTDLPSCCVQR
jgi:hypothetical protein